MLGENTNVSAKESSDHLKDCRCFDCVKEVVKMIMPNGTEVITEVAVIRGDYGNSYLCRGVYEGPVILYA